MDEILQEIKNSKNAEELYSLLRDCPEVFHLTFRRDILAKFEEFASCKGGVK